jgi:uncharacterized membrane protein YgdD (TMEM256/DUF423 family)
LRSLSTLHRAVAVTAAILGAVCVAAGAFGAHAMSGDPRATSLLHTGASYGFWHVLAALLACLRGAGIVGLVFVIGALLFSFSLWLLALGAPAILGIVTPFGGAAFILGWLLFAWTLWRGSSAGIV